MVSFCFPSSNCFASSCYSPVTVRRQRDFLISRSRNAFCFSSSESVSPATRLENGGTGDKSRGKMTQIGENLRPLNDGKLSAMADVDKSRGFCPCKRRHFIGASGPALLLNFPAKADPESDSRAMLNKVHPPKPDWYEEFYASFMSQGMKSYEAEIAGYKAQLFDHLKEGDKRLLELGIGTGPNFKYYAGVSGLHVFGVDPNKQMEKYAQAAAVKAGLPSTSFKFILAVGETLPIPDASMDVVVGTLVLCSVKDVSMALKEVKRVLKPGGLYIFVEHVAASDGTPLRFLQSVLDPLQQIVADGCHLTRETGKEISKAGFSDVNINTASLSNALLIFPHVYGIACK